MYQSKLLQLIQQKIDPKISFIEAIANVLDISYDAAHRRIALKSKLSMNEFVKLAQHYNVSLDYLFATTDQKVIPMTKTLTITKEKDLQTYFESSTLSLTPLLTQKNSKILYSAKDIPLFYTVSENNLSRFKWYVWLKLLDENFDYKQFTDYHPSQAVVKAGVALGELYKNLNITEIWDVTTVNSTLKQIHFYFQAGHISLSMALELCEELKKIILRVSDKVRPNNKNYQLYYNELLLMNNNVLVTANNKQSLFVPFTVLSYYLTSDSATCTQANRYFMRQKKNSKLLNIAGEKDKDAFFNKMISKIDALSQLITASETLGFE